MEKIFDFISKKYHIDKDSAISKRKELCLKHNTKFTLVALSKEGVDPDLFIQNTYLSVNLTKCGLREDKRLFESLALLSSERVVLTNNPASFGRYVLKILGVEELFSAIYGMVEMKYVLKPDPCAFQVVKEALQQGRRVVFVDDEIQNIKTAQNLGCTTVFVCENGVTSEKYRGHITSSISDEVRYVD
jgi:FMN phosphatase YigB (HAD superfamily)